jgi:hypothetical protein
MNDNQQNSNPPVRKPFPPRLPVKPSERLVPPEEPTFEPWEETEAGDTGLKAPYKPSARLNTAAQLRKPAAVSPVGHPVPPQARGNSYSAEPRGSLAPENRTGLISCNRMSSSENRPGSTPETRNGAASETRTGLASGTRAGLPGEPRYNANAEARARQAEEIRAPAAVEPRANAHSEPRIKPGSDARPRPALEVRPVQAAEARAGRVADVQLNPGDAPRTVLAPVTRANSAAQPRANPTLESPARRPQESRPSQTVEIRSKPVGEERLKPLSDIRTREADTTGARLAPDNHASSVADTSMRFGEDAPSAQAVETPTLEVGSLPMPTFEPRAPLLLPRGQRPKLPIETLGTSASEALSRLLPRIELRPANAANGLSALRQMGSGLLSRLNPQPSTEPLPIAAMEVQEAAPSIATVDVSETETGMVATAALVAETGVQDTQSPVVPELSTLLERLTNMPAQTAILGVCDDRLPVLLDLSDPAPGALLLASDNEALRTRLLRTLLQTAAALNSPRSVQFLILSSRPDDWRVWLQSVDISRHCLGVDSLEDSGPDRWLLKLAGWADQRRTGSSGPAVILVVDDMSAVPKMEYDARVNFDWLVKEGPPVRIWPVGALAVEQAPDLARWVRLFKTRILGPAVNPTLYRQLATLDEDDSAALVEESQFAVRIENNWLKFRLPLLPGESQ